MKPVLLQHRERTLERRLICTLLRCCVMASMPVMAQPEVIERWFFDTYVDSYLNEAPDFYTANYTSEVRFVTPDSAELLALDDLIAAMNAAYVEPWVARGWSSTSAVSATVQQLSGQTFLLSAEWSMSDETGASVTHCDRPVWHYLITTATAGGPKIYSEIQGDCLN